MYSSGGVKTEHGKVVYVISFSYDITQQENHDTAHSIRDAKSIRKAVCGKPSIKLWAHEMVSFYPK